MKKKELERKPLVLTKQKVRDLVPLSHAELAAVNGAGGKHETTHYL